MKSHLSLLSAGLLVLPLALAACGSGSGGGKVVLPRPTPAKSPNEPNASREKEKTDAKKSDSENKSSDSIEKKVEPTPAPTPTIDPALQSIQGSYFSSEFYPGISRSLVITDSKFVSKVRGASYEPLEVAEQTEEGSVIVAADGSLSLSVEKSSCDGRGDSLVTSTAKLARFTHLQAGENSLEFKFPERDAGRAGSMKKVDALPEVVIEDGSKLVDACWYEYADDVIFPRK